MPDYQCKHCSDYGDCRMCSKFFQGEKMHYCGFKWKDHEYDAWYAAQCPTKENNVQH